MRSDFEEDFNPQDLGIGGKLINSNSYARMYGISDPPL